MQSIQTGH